MKLFILAALIISSCGGPDRLEGNWTFRVRTSPATGCTSIVNFDAGKGYSNCSGAFDNARAEYLPNRHIKITFGPNVCDIVQHGESAFGIAADGSECSGEKWWTSL